MGRTRLAAGTDDLRMSTRLCAIPGSCRSPGPRHRRRRTFGSSGKRAASPVAPMSCPTSPRFWGAWRRAGSPTSGPTTRSSASLFAGTELRSSIPATNGTSPSPASARSSTRSTEPGNGEREEQQRRGVAPSCRRPAGVLARFRDRASHPPEEVSAPQSAGSVRPPPKRRSRTRPRSDLRQLGDGPLAAGCTTIWLQRSWQQDPQDKRD